MLNIAAFQKGLFKGGGGRVTDRSVIEGGSSVHERFLNNYNDVIIVVMY